MFPVLLKYNKTFSGCGEVLQSVAVLLVFDSFMK